jgi:hypothetical protein
MNSDPVVLIKCELNQLLSMKRNFKTALVSLLFVTAPLILLAQPHPNKGNIPGAGNEPVGGGAAIGSGLSVMLAMGVAYGARRFYQSRRLSQIVTTQKEGVYHYTSDKH